ncbi:hypothetical protein [Glutamicibacter sp. JC586]|uniref:hypothetical protein n=1 Tax=Glutamicibacter sp. JC586 TaxID=2590552 RepID=UPI001357F228|nr:hypothetical protein [Glutamicibacter sp. JC586]
MKLTYKNEQDIVNLVSHIDDSAVCFYPAESVLAHKFLASLRSGNLDQRERPDFEDLSASLLLESMIVDDHPRPGKKDKTRAREGAVLREIKELGLAVHSEATVVAAVSSGLPTDQDHNYRSYIYQFKRTISDHARKVEVYHAERRGFDLGFLVLDESTAYFESLGSFGRTGQGKPHYWFADSAFTDVMVQSGVDCFIWVTPYKVLPTLDVGEISLPTVAVIDVALLAKTEPHVYNVQRMISAEI